MVCLWLGPVPPASQEQGSQPRASSTSLGTGVSQGWVRILTCGQAHRGNRCPAQPWDVWAGLWGWGWAEARLEKAVCLKAGLLALTGALGFLRAAPSAQGPALLFPDCPSTPRARPLGSRCPGSTQYPAGKWAQSHSIHLSSERAFGFIYDCKTCG